MIIKDYSCAKAHFVKKGEEPEIVWAWLTGMFDKAEKKVPSGTRVTNFIAGGYYLIPFQKGYVSSSREGDVFKYDNTGGPGSTTYVKIEEWEPYLTFTFTETYNPSSGPKVGTIVAKSPPTVMKFSLEKHPEGTMVIVERIEVVLRSLKEKMSDKLMGRFDENTCVARLAFILDYPNFPKGLSKYIDDVYTIVRDDSLKNKLPNYPRYEG